MKTQKEQIWAFLCLGVHIYFSAKAAKGKRGPTPRLQRQVELINQLPRAKQKFVMEMLDAVIQQQAS